MRADHPSDESELPFPSDIELIADCDARADENFLILDQMESEDLQKKQI